MMHRGALFSSGTSLVAHVADLVSRGVNTDVATTTVFAEAVEQLRAQWRRHEPIDADWERRAVNELWFARNWALDGGPQIAPSHRLAASLMATSIPAECVPDVALPWNAFVVLVPTGMLGFRPVQWSRDNAVDHVRIARTGDDCLFVSVNDSIEPIYLSLWNAQGVAMLARSAEGAVTDPSMGEAATRAVAMACRLALGVCIELDSPEHKARAQGGGRAKRSGPPKAWTYQLTRDVKVDCRAWLSEYVAKGGRSPTVQSLVRGHHKRQPCGPGRSERKWIHVEPYWRGPEDAPIAVRSHALDGGGAR